MWMTSWLCQVGLATGPNPITTLSNPWVLALTSPQPALLATKRHLRGSQIPFIDI